ncbi:MAG: YfhO family protein [Bacteroidales bacterium]|nr:YfhO family protein [Bacteroidales bacterium]
MDKKLLKNIGIGLGAIVLFLVLSYGFVPQVLRGKIVNQSDISGYIGMSHEMSEWNAAHPDDPTYWTDSMFGGMPTTAISTQNGGDYTQGLYNLLLAGKRPATYLFIALLGAFLLMLSLGISWPLALGGAVAVAFCSYNFQIIQVGHNTKMQAIAFFPWVLAALVYTYRSTEAKGRWLAKVLLGAALFGVALSMQIKANHQQITYYLAILVLLYALVEFIDILVRKDKDSLAAKATRKTRLTRFFIASALLLVLGGAGIATNVNKLLPLAKYTPNTMRGGSDLTQDGAVKGGGLDLDYATAWSYGWEELPNLMIPNFNGGSSSQPVDPAKSETIQLLRRAGQSNLREIAKGLPLYWGPQPFTAGPMYMGAITIFLFILGLFLYKGKEKWWLIVGTVIAVLMAVGSHFMAFTKFCFNVLPLYNKFRTVSMALVVLQVTLPVLGFLTLDRIVKDGYDRKGFLKKSGIAFALTGGLSLLFFLIPTLAGDFSSAADAGQQDILVEAFQADRIALLRQDALMSFFLIAITWGFLLWACLSEQKNPVRKVVASLAICALVLVNLFATGKRYLNADHFTTPKDFNKPFAERPVDKMVKADPDPSYRVLDLSVNVFNSAVPSYHHKSVGGYSPAKLQRYQDLIEHYLTGEINRIYGVLQTAETIEDVEAGLPDTPLLNALNTRYIIIDGDFPPLHNPNTLGNAWFVDKVVPAATADEEIAFLGSVDLRHEAVIGKDMPAVTAAPADTADVITLTAYAPNELRYHYAASTDRLAVFSEIYYPDGWKAQVDGAPVDVLRADWTLRAAVLPAGEHDLVMRFEPDSYRTGAAVSRASSISLILLLLLSIGGLFLPARKKE